MAERVLQTMRQRLEDEFAQSGRRATMTRISIGDTTRGGTLGAIALFVWIAYLLGCLAFSPDDRRVLFPTFDPESGFMLVAVYDRSDGRIQPLVEVPGGRGVRTAWTADGSHAIVIADATLLMVPVARPGPLKLFYVPDHESLFAGGIVAPPIVGTRILLNTENLIVSLDLETGTRKSKESPELVLAQAADQVYYLRLLEAAEGAAEQMIEIGVVDLNSLAPSALFTADGGDEAPGHFAVTRDGRRAAVVTSSNEVHEVRLFEDGALSRTVPIGPRGAVEVGNLLWSPDGLTLYAAVCEPLDEERHGFGVAAIPAGGGAVHRIPVFAVRGWRDEMIHTAQIDLSHRGDTLAVASPPEDRALYLVDLSTPDYTVTRVPVTMAGTLESRQ
jgi:hypothetical protein